jgi:hypothetical protein
MAFLREEIALRRAQIDAEKKAAASQKATNDALRGEQAVRRAPRAIFRLPIFTLNHMRM